MERLYIFGVDRLVFEQMLDLPMRDHLLAFLDGRQDLAKGYPTHWERFAEFGDDPSDSIYFRIVSGFKVRRYFHGKSRFLTHEEIRDLPELAVSTRDFIRSTSSFSYLCLLELFSEFAPYSFLRRLVYRRKASWVFGWVRFLLNAFEYWYGPESSEAKAVSELFSRLCWAGESYMTMAARGFPLLPRKDQMYDTRINGWNTDETQFAILNIKTLLEFGQPPHREEQQSRFWAWNQKSERTAEENEMWTLVCQFMDDLLSLEEYANPAVISFDDY